MRSGGAMVLGLYPTIIQIVERPGTGELPVPRRPTIWMIVGQGPIALAVGAGGGKFGHFNSPLCFLSSFSLSLGDGPI